MKTLITHYRQCLNLEPGVSKLHVSGVVLLLFAMHDT